MMVQNLLLLSVGLELLLYLLAPIWKLRIFWVYLILALIAFTLPLSAINSSNVLYSAITAVSIFRAINLLRILKHRMHDKYLLQVTRKTAMWLGGSQALFLIVLRLDLATIDWTSFRTLTLLASL